MLSAYEDPDTVLSTLHARPIEFNPSHNLRGPSNTTLLSRIRRLSVDSLSQWFSMVCFALELPAGLDKTPIIDSFPWSI